MTISSKKLEVLKKQGKKEVLKKQGKKEEKFHEKKTHLFAHRNVERRKKEGWKEIKKPFDKHGRELGINSHAEDLVLMEK